MFEIIFYILTIKYLTRLFMLDHRGPYESANKQVYWESELGQESVPVNLFDWIKRFFGAYKIKDFIWEVRNPNLWLCPYCLSFRINLIFLLPFVLFTGQSTVLSILLIFAVPDLVGWMLD